jgi:hypothetical protein
MKKNITVIAGVLLFALVAAATDIPKYETFLGYTYVRANSFNQNTGLGQRIGGFDMNGGSGQFIYNCNHWLSVVADGGAVYKPNVGIVNVQNTTAFTLAGPRVSYRRWSRYTPYAQVLFGAAYRSVSRRVNAVTDLNTPVLPVVSPANLFPGPGEQITARVNASQNGYFAMAAGGGLDIKVNKHFSFRPVSVDYLLTRFPNLSTGSNENQNSIRASAGFIFTFGKE